MYGARRSIQPSENTALGIENITQSGGPLHLAERGRLCDFAISLATAGPASGRPGEVSNGDDEEAVASIGDTSQGVIPGRKGRKQTKQTSSLLDVDIGLVVSATLQVGDTEKQESQVQEEEEEEESNGRFECAEQHDGREDEPALLENQPMSQQSTQIACPIWTS